MHGADTHDTLWKYCVHGFQALFDGVHSPLDPDGDEWPHGLPAHKKAGTPIANGELRSICWGLAQDMDQASNEYGWAHFNANVDTCGWRPANRTWCNIRDVSPNAPWKPLCYVAGPAARPVSRHRIWGVPGVLRFSFFGDLMHGGDLGPLLHLHASTIEELTHRGGACFDKNNASGLQNFVKALISAYSATGVQKKIQSITAEMVRQDGGTYPVVSIKAAESRHLLKPMIEILERPNIRSGSDHDEHRLACYKHLDKLYDIIVEGGLFLTAAESSEVLQHTEDFLLHYNCLAVEAMTNGVLRWGMTTKFHFLWHLAWFARRQNPRCPWCYSFEDFIGKVQSAAMSCTAGTPMHLVPSQVTSNYIWAVSLQSAAFAR